MENLLYTIAAAVVDALASGNLASRFALSSSAICSTMQMSLSLLPLAGGENEGCRWQYLILERDITVVMGIVQECRMVPRVLLILFECPEW